VSEQDEEPQTDLAAQAQWRTPPPSYRKQDWTNVLELLKSRPGEWLLIGDGVPIAVANAIRQGSIAALRDGVSVRTRNNTRGENRTLTLYLKWDSVTTRRRKSRKQLPKHLPKEKK